MGSPQAEALGKLELPFALANSKQSNKKVGKAVCSF